MASYKLPLNSLSLGIQEFNYHLDAPFFNGIEATEIREASVEAMVTASRKSDDTFQLDFILKGNVTIPCDRCLDSMVLPVDTTYHLSVKEGDTFDDSRDNTLEIPGTWRMLDLAPLMRDTVLLTIPIKHVHPDGECNAQMASCLEAHRAHHLADDHAMRNTDETQHGNFTLGDDPRWEALKTLKDKN